MKIKEVELTNIKCYSNSKFKFENGINFISGMNGAGKTSIIESIGFALFDYKIGKSGFATYFIKKGEKKGTVRIIFEDKEKQVYIVERIIRTTSNNSWIIKDIKNEEEVVSGDIDVTNWLKDHLGFYRNDNMAEIYENIISVPQGMFTSTFLDTAQNRKNKFDPIFNLEIYRTVFKNTAGLESGLRDKKILKEKEKGQIDVKIEMLKNDETEYKNLKKEEKVIKQQKKEKMEKFRNIDKAYQEKSKVKEEITKIEEAMKIDKINKTNMEANVTSFTKELKISSEAQQVLEENKEGYENHIKEEEKQKELKKQKKKFDILNENKKILEINIRETNKLIEAKNERKGEIHQSIKVMQSEIKENDEKIEEESRILNKKLLTLEEEKRNIDGLQALTITIEEEKRSIDTNNLIIQGYLNDIKKSENITNKEKELLEQKQNLEEQIKNKEKIEEENKKVEEQLNKILARLEHLKESKKIAKEGVCPYLKSECINVKGKSEEEYNQEIILVEKEKNEIKKEKSKIETEEKNIIGAETEIKNVISKIQELQKTKQEIISLQSKIKEIEEISKKAEEKIFQILENNGISKELEKINEFKKFTQTKTNDFNEKDKEYNIYKTKYDNNKKEQERRKAEQEKNEKLLKKIEDEIKKENKKVLEYRQKQEETDNELKEYVYIEKEIEENEKKLQDTKVAYDTYMRKKEIASKLEELEKKLAKATDELNKVNETLVDKSNKLKELNKNYDEAEFQKIEQEREILNKKLVEININIDNIDTRIANLKEKVDELKNQKELLIETEKKIVLYQKVIEYLVKIRQIIKQAPEDIAEVLIQKVSKKATEMYSQIANDNTRLEWREGYEVILVDNIDGKIIEKEFKQLSGGEQMSAALSIRISMLEVLTSLKIGILDEPTTNMDVGRRQRLAEIIESIGGLFIQLFIVSHDDTFNSITENTIQL